jgi:hypothetical protein
VFCVLASFGLAAVLAAFQNIGRFFPNNLVTLNSRLKASAFFSLQQKILVV